MSVDFIHSFNSPNVRERARERRKLARIFLCHRIRVFQSSLALEFSRERKPTFLSRLRLFLFASGMNLHFHPSKNQFVSETRAWKTKNRSCSRQQELQWSNTEKSTIFDLVRITWRFGEVNSAMISIRHTAASSWAFVSGQNIVSKAFSVKSFRFLLRSTSTFPVLWSTRREKAAKDCEVSDCIQKT